MIVRVIAHTAFHGVPEQLLPPDQGERDGSPSPLSQVREKGQDTGTQQERLIECAGRTCYDSYGKGRDSAAYHQHIMDVQHGSVQEHASLSYFISGVSRGLSHELVRHRVGVAISQRSTRYVDENESPWMWHPLLDAYVADLVNYPKHVPPGDHAMAEARAKQADYVEDALEDSVRKGAQQAYKEIVEKLQIWLTTKGVDKLTARKQARGAARGLLGNALMTELVWTCNLRALRTVLDQRAKAAADAEIRLLANRLYEEALPYFPTYLGRYQKRTCPDGIGYELYEPDPRDAALLDQEKIIARQTAVIEKLNNQLNDALRDHANERGS